LHVVDRRPEQAPVALAAIRDASREALEELRGTLAVFRRAQGGQGRGPLPGLGRLEALVGSLVQAGRPVELVWGGEPVAVGPAVDAAAYRIVQEALTNVVRHAGGARAVVEVFYEVGRVRVRVVDEGPGGVVVEGMGVAGMRERAAAVGGSLTVGPGEQGGFVVCAVLPVGVSGERGAGGGR
jgi:signal transduction histidine kinase